MRPVIGIKQKIASYFLVIPFLTYGIYIIFYHDFVPAPSLYGPVPFIAFVPTVAAIGLIVFMYRNGSWVLGKPNAGATKKAILFTFLSLTYYLLILLNTILVIPRIYTSVAGTKITATEAITRKFIDSGKACDFAIETKNYRGLGFHLCISPTLFNVLPSHGGDIQLDIMKSSLGSIVQVSKDN